MNSLHIIGNLTQDPESRVTAGGKSVCHFTVAVNKKGTTNEALFFRVSAWGKLGENCQKYLAKGRKVSVCGPVSAEAYIRDSAAVATMQIMAEDVEFLSGKAEETQKAEPKTKEKIVLEDETDLPF